MSSNDKKVLAEHATAALLAAHILLFKMFGQKKGNGFDRS